MTENCSWCKIGRMTRGIVLSDENICDGDFVLILFSHGSITVQFTPGGFTNIFEIDIPIIYCPMCQTHTGNLNNSTENEKCACSTGKVCGLWDSETEIIEVSITGQGIQISYQFVEFPEQNWIETIPISYCPFCGKKLNETGSSG